MHTSEFKGQHSRRDPRLYFDDAEYSSYNNGSWTFTIEKNYPYLVNIHCDEVAEYKSSSNTFFIELRKFVERRCEGDVVFEYKSMNYRWWWNKEATTEWSRNYSEITHGYWYLYFESEADLGMFALMHGGKCSRVQKYHPEYGENILEQESMYGESA